MPDHHDTINELANVGLRSSAVRGQLAKGLRHVAAATTISSVADGNDKIADLVVDDIRAI